jgi:hypothetical protein
MNSLRKLCESLSECDDPLVTLSHVRLRIGQVRIETVREAESVINDVCVSERFGGPSALTRAAYIVMLERASESLNRKAPRTSAQLSILVRNISSLFFDNGEERLLVRIACLTTIVNICTFWKRLISEAPVKNRCPACLAF